MTEISHNALIYKDMIYTFEAKEKTGEFFVHFYPGTESRFKVSVPVNAFSQYALEEIVLKNNKKFSEFNVINLYSLVLGSEVEIHSAFLTFDEHDNPLVRISMFGCGDRKKPIILDFDVSTGISLTYLLKQPLCMVKDLFESKAVI